MPIPCNSLSVHSTVPPNALIPGSLTCLLLEIPGRLCGPPTTAKLLGTGELRKDHHIYLSVCLSVCLSISLSLYLSIYLSIHLSYLPFYICLSIYLSIYLYLSVCLMSVCLSFFFVVVVDICCSTRSVFPSLSLYASGLTSTVSFQLILDSQITRVDLPQSNNPFGGGSGTSDFNHSMTHSLTQTQETKPSVRLCPFQHPRALNAHASWGVTTYRCR